jgi:hypothetical protein
MSTLASVVIQDLTYTEKSLGLGVSVTYTNDGVAGSEVVSVLDHAISIKIQSGVSTATQIKTAVDANILAMTQVSVAISGTGSNVQVSAVNAALANGSVALAASKQIGGILYTAKATGTSGNSIRIKYEHHLTTLSAVAAGNDITVTFNSGVTKMSAIMATIRADSACNALVSVAKMVPDSEQLIAYAIVFTSLVGGAAAVAGSVVVQDLTYSSDLLDNSRNGSKITYTIGATAGAEVVTVTGNDVSIQIQNGTSTATQIKTAFDASAAADGVAATGSIVVSDYANLHATKASGTVTFGSPDVLTAASGTITLENYEVLHKQQSSRVIQDLTYTAIAYGPAGDLISVAYIADLAGSGDVAVVEVTGPDTTIVVHMDDTAITGTTANTIKAAVNADSEASLVVLASGSSSNVQAEQVTPLNLEDGQNAATVTINGIVLTESTEWIAATSNDDSAASIASAITTATATTLCTATAVATNVISIVANLAGTAGNAITVATSDVANLAKSGSHLSGGKVASAITVAGTTFTAVASAPGATEFVIIADLTSLINALVSVNATDDGSIITVVAANVGTAGNAIAMSKIGAGLTLSGSLLTGGINAGTVTIAGHLLTESAEWTAATDNATTTESLKDAIHALTEVNATRTSSTVNIVAASKGSAGNAITIATNDAVRLLKSGLTLSGGTDKLACTISGTGGTAQKTVNALALSGGIGNGSRASFTSQASLTLTTAYQLINFNFTSRQMVIINDETTGTKAIVYSYDGIHDHGQIDPNEALTLDTANANGVFLKYANGAPAYKVMASAL